MDSATIKQRFENLNAVRPFSARWLSDSMKVNRYSINKILAGDFDSEKDKLLFRAVLERLGLTEAEFLAGDHPAQSLAPTPSKAGEVALYGDIPAGNPTWFEPSTVPAQWIAPPPGVAAKNLFALRVQGESMLPRFEQGDIVYFERLDIDIGVKDPEKPIPSLTFERLNGRIVAVLIDGEATMKQLKLVGNGEKYALILKAFNPDFPNIMVKAHNEVRFQGYGVSMLRQKL
jgi:SOS-response transcriptional repressor LexA